MVDAEISRDAKAYERLTAIGFEFVETSRGIVCQFKTALGRFESTHKTLREAITRAVIAVKGGV